MEQETHTSAAVQGGSLRVLLDARKLADGGIGKYIHNLILGLIDHDEVELSILVRPGQSELGLWRGRVRMLEEAAGCYSLDEMLFMPLRIRKAGGFDVFHAPHYTLPWRLRMPTVVTIHDTIHLRFSARWYHAFFARFLITSALRRARRVIAVSQSACQDLIGLLRARRDIISRIRVIPNAIDPSFLKRSESREAASEYVSNRFHLQSPYYLAVLSNAKQHKGIEDLLEAFSGFRKKMASAGMSSPRLVLVGKGAEALVELTDVLDKTGETPGVHLLGTVQTEELYHLYRAASAVVVASYAEGFCLPVLEAHVCGAPVVARPVPAVQELLCDGDQVCHDYSTAALERALFEFCQSDREKRREPSLPEVQEQLLKYSAQRTADQVLEVYREAVRSGRRDV